MVNYTHDRFAAQAVFLLHFKSNTVANIEILIISSGKYIASEKDNVDFYLAKMLS